MNDIERQIEGDFEEEKREEKSEIKHKLNHGRDDDKKKKWLIYALLGVLLLGVVSLSIYLIIGNSKENNNDKDKTPINNNNNIEEPNKEEDNIGYVSCDDNTSLLNVRNSTNGNIIDGLSCYKEVTIEEELEGTEVCDNWYKVKYEKRGSSYTGYACGTYIKKREVSESTVKTVRDLVDKATNYYENNFLKAYCGKTNGSKTIAFEENMNGEYLKSEYKTIKELKEYLLSFLDESLIKPKLELSDIDKPKYYDNYYEIDGNLYCRNYSGKGWLTYYTGNYDVEVTSETEDKIVANIAYEYLTEDSKCDIKDLSNCSKSNFVYELGKVTLEKKDNGYIVTKIDFHE